MSSLRRALILMLTCGSLFAETKFVKKDTSSVIVEKYIYIAESEADVDYFLGTDSFKESSFDFLPKVAVLAANFKSIKKEFEMAEYVIELGVSNQDSNSHVAFKRVYDALGNSWYF